MLTEIKPLLEVETKLQELLNTTQENCNLCACKCGIYIENMQAKLEKLKFVSHTDLREKREFPNWFWGFFGLKKLD